MKFRPDSTTSERQLILAMAETGRPIALTALVNWRQDGLLPPLANQGRGPGKGKSYYWREDNIVAHACAAFDFLGKYGRPDTTTWMLWLSGFSVPLPQLRRAWAHRIKMRGTLTVRPIKKFSVPSASCDSTLGFDFASGPARLLLKAVLTIGSAVAPADDNESKEIVEILRGALLRVTRANRADVAAQTELAEQLWRIIKLLGSSPEAGSLIREAGEIEFRDAQRYICAAARLLRTCETRQRTASVAPGPLWSAWLAERMGPPLFLLILVMLRAGNRQMLDDLACVIEQASRTETSPPARLYAAAIRASSSESETKMPRSA